VLVRGCWNYSYLHKGLGIIFRITLLVADLRIPELILLDTLNNGSVEGKGFGG